MIVRCFSPGSTTPFIAQLSLSVPPEVKKISSGRAPIQSAITALASARAFFGLRSKSIRLRSISIILQQEWLHCLKSINIQLCRCCVICVDKMLHGSTSIVVLNIRYRVFPGNIELFRINDTKLLLDNCSHFLCGSRQYSMNSCGSMSSFDFA